MPPPAAALRALLSSARSERRCLVMPACHDALSAALIARAGFEVAFMSGYAVSATSLALPDAGLISYGEQVQVARNVCEATRGCGLLVTGDGDTGFGGSGNVRRTVRGYAAAGLAGITIEDQVRFRVEVRVRVGARTGPHPNPNRVARVGLAPGVSQARRCIPSAARTRAGWPSRAVRAQ